MDRILRIPSILFPCLILLSSCSNEKINIDQPKPQFIASESDLSDYKTWELKKSYLSAANKQWRKIYVKIPPGKSVVNGVYPQGTLILKEVHNGVNESDPILRYQAMSKRGGDFNPQGLGWEWILSYGKPENITTRGGNTVSVGGKTCIGCHKGKQDLVVSSF